MRRIRAGSTASGQERNPIKSLEKAGIIWSRCRVSIRWGAVMKLMRAIFFAGAMALSSAPAHAVVLDLSTMTCKQFVEGEPDEIKMVLTWMDGWYKGDSDEAIIDTEVFVANAKKFGTFCRANPNISIVNAAEKILGK
jgi:acid stress chaperone HdeB